MSYVNVIVDNKSRHTDNLFTYKTADGQDGEPDVHIGDRVLITFGAGNKPKTGYVFQYTELPPDCSPDRIKSIEGRDDSLPLTEEIMATAGWMKQRYGIRYSDCVNCFVPKGKAPGEGKAKEPYAGIEGEYNRPKALTAEQQAAAERINRALNEGRQESFLLHGVTSSGKTEVYMEAIETCLDMGKTAIMLVPEIALTSQIIARFAGRFGKSNIAVMHSKLTARERYDEWQRIRRGDARIVIGARMGVFAPLSDIGAIIMDEEHEATYKADMTPKYETVDVALKRLKYYNGVLILGSATPSVVSYQRAAEGIYTLLELKKRYNETPLPKVEIVDMRLELKEGNMSIFSRRLSEKMEETLGKNEQVILFQNRRGYSGFVACRKCGAVQKCPRCAISLTYHKGIDRLVCHYCGRKFPVPDVCPQCGSKYMKFAGIGTEQVEEAAASLFPGTSVDRLDLDAIGNRKDMDRILGNFAKGRTDILIGTQLVAKGLDFQNVGLVGVISADVTLNIPDYRSTERTFQLITQVSGRAGRGDHQGTVIVQTSEPDNYAIQAAKDNDYEEFFRQEIRLRQFMDYPPFTDIVMVNFTAEDEDICFGTAERCRRYMENAIGPGSENQVFNPKVAVNFKGEDHRCYILIKCPRGNRNRYIYYLDNFSRILIKEKIDCSMNIDVNPYSTI